MPVNIIGSYPKLSRVRTGLFSLDCALSSRGDLGLPLRSLLELYGYTNSGKSTLAYYLASKATETGNAAICDLENADVEYIKTTMGREMDGDVYIVDLVDAKGGYIKHEEMLKDMVIHLAKEDYGATILDSVGGIIPVAESTGDFGEAHMGKRAKLVGQVARSVVDILRVKSRPSLSIVINHVLPVLGGRGHTTAGGEALKFLATMRIMIWSRETFTFSEDDPRPIGFLVDGKVEKLRFGGKGRSFQYYIVPGYGVHTGASAMFDCFELGLAERGATVKLDGKSLGYLKKDLLSYAEEGKHRKFEPFREAIQQYEETIRLQEVVQEEEVVDLGNGHGEKKRKRSKDETS
jgi:recombination protein RecA